MRCKQNRSSNSFRKGFLVPAVDRKPHAGKQTTSNRWVGTVPMDIVFVRTFELDGRPRGLSPYLDVRILLGKISPLFPIHSYS